MLTRSASLLSSSVLYLYPLLPALLILRRQQHSPLAPGCTDHHLRIMLPKLRYCPPFVFTKPSHANNPTMQGKACGESSLTTGPRCRVHPWRSSQRRPRPQPWPCCMSCPAASPRQIIRICADRHEQHELNLLGAATDRHASCALLLRKLIQLPHCPGDTVACKHVMCHHSKDHSGGALGCTRTACRAADMRTVSRADNHRVAITQEFFGKSSSYTCAALRS